MRTLWLIACVLNAACVNHLARGDQAFAQRRWTQAAEAWNAVDGHDDEAALRLALLHATSNSGLHDPERSRALVEFIRSQWPETPAGAMARVWLDANAREALARARVDVLEATLRLHEEWLGHLRRQAERAREADAFSLAQAEETRSKLQSEVERLRVQLEEASALQEENAALREELEALKSIDLRH